MSLDRYTAVNCTVPHDSPATLSFAAWMCCLEMRSVWVAGEAGAKYCKITDMPVTDPAVSWSRCLGKTAARNETLAALLVDAGQLCFPAPGAVTSFFLVMCLFGAIAAPLILLGGIGCYFLSRGKVKPYQRTKRDEEAAAAAAEGEGERELLFTADDEGTSEHDAKSDDGEATETDRLLRSEDGARSEYDGQNEGKTTTAGSEYGYGEHDEKGQ